MGQNQPIHPQSPLLPGCVPSLPAAFYHDEQRYRDELARIWARNWVYAGRDSDLPPSTMRRAEVAGSQILLVKDAKGRVTAFHNTCAHRGSELCAEHQRQLKSQLIVCPYHQWSFSLAGDLVRTPFVSITDDFRKEEHGLIKVAVHLWNGFLFVCLASEPPPFDGVPDMGPGFLDNWPMDRLVTGHVWVKELACNWKIFWENYNECLHCPGIHPELSQMVPIYSQGYMAPDEAPGWEPGQEAKAPLKPGAATWSMNGQPCGPPFEGLTEAERQAGLNFVTLLPTMFIVAHVDYVRAVSLRPLGPERTELRAEWLFLPETLAAPGFDLANVVDFASLVLKQDGDAAEMNQRGIRNPAFRGGTLMPQEFDVYRFQQWVQSRMAG